MHAKPPPFRVKVRYRDDALFEWLQANIDVPIDNHTQVGLVAEIAGWVAYFPDSGEPRPTSVVINVGEFGWLEAPIELARPDVFESKKRETGREILTELCGFSLLLPAHLIRSGGPYTLSVRCRNDAGEVLHEFAEISFVSLAKKSWRIPTKVQPLIVNSVGRSGSSLLCRMLDTHPVIHVPTGSDQFGEISICEYVCRMMSVLSSEGNYSCLNKLGDLPDFHSLSPPNMCSRMLRRGSSEEFQHEAMLQSLTENARTMAHSVLTDFIAYVSSDRPWLRYVAEKSWNSYNLNLLGMLFDRPKEVFIVRQPAEFLRSQQAFLRKEGHTSEHIQRHHRATANRLGNLARSRNDRKESSHVVKFEELLAQPIDVLSSLLDYLELERSEAFLDAASAMIGDDSSHSRMLKTERTNSADADFGAYLASLDASERTNLDAFLRVFDYA